MRRLAFVLFLAGVVLCSWFAARPAMLGMDTAHGDEPTTSMERLAAWGGAAGWPFAIGIILMTVGGVVARRAEAPRIGTEETEVTSGDTVAMLRQIEAAVSALPTAPPEECAGELHEQLDTILEDLVPAFLEQRAHIVADLGLVRYAEMSSAFASAERSLGRAWSALTDEAWEEVSPRLDLARASMATALRVASERQ